jgi:hypothetical protein
VYNQECRESQAAKLLLQAENADFIGIMADKSNVIRSVKLAVLARCRTDQAL